MINEIGLSPTTSDNVYFANNEQASIAVFTAVFYFTQVEHNLINLNYVKLDQRKLFTVFQSVLYVKFKEANKICSPSKISKSVNAE